MSTTVHNKPWNPPQWPDYSKIETYKQALRDIASLRATKDGMKVAKDIANRALEGDYEIQHQ